MVTEFSKRLWGGVVALFFVVGCSTAPAEKPEASSGREAKETAKVVLAPALQLVPADAAGFIHLRLADLWESAAFAEVRSILAKAGPQALHLFEEKYVPAPGQVESVTLIFQTPESVGTPIFSSFANHVSPVLAVTTTKSFDRAQLEKAFGPNAQPKKHKDQNYFSVAANQSAFRFVDERTFVVASEKALRQWLSRPAGAGQHGPLQAALLEANHKHDVVIGFNPQALPKEAFGPFRSSTKTFNKVSNVIGNPTAPEPQSNKTFNKVSAAIGGTPAPQPVPVEKPKADLWASVAQPLLKARCLTLTLDLDSKLHGNVKLDFDGDEHADNGVKAVRAGLEAAREALASAAQDLERELRDGPKTFSFGKPAAKKPAGPKALARDIDQAASDVFSLVQIGMYRALDEQLHALAVERQGKSVRLQASAPMNATALVFGVTAMTSLGRSANSTFESVGNSIELPPQPGLDPKPGPVFKPVLPPGTRAVAVRVHVEPFLGMSAVLPLTRVDLIWSTEKEKNKVVSKILLENVLAVAVDMAGKGEKEDPSLYVATLALTPEDAAKVARAQGTGSLSLILRPSRDENRKFEQKK